MSKLGDIKPPDDTPDELSRYLIRLFLQTDITLGQNNKISKSSVLPGKPQNGNIYYFDQIILPDIVTIGFWGYANDSWVYLGADNSVVAAYGGVEIGTPWTAANIGVAWQTIAFDTESLSIPRGIVQDTINEGLGITYAGVYNFNINLDIKHNSLNAGRVMQLRLYNPTTGTGSSSINIGTARDVEHTNVAIPGKLLELLVSEEGNVLQVQMSSSTDTYSTVSVETGHMSVNMVSERRF